MKRRTAIVSSAFAAILLAGCATEGTGGSADFYGGYYDDWWYGGAWGAGCCPDYPGDVGPPRPEHPIALPPGSTPRPENPIASPPGGAQPKATTSLPSARPAAPMRGGGMRGGGGGRR